MVETGFVHPTGENGVLTAAMPIDATPPPGGWTVDDLETFPPDGRRYELLDGVLIVSPSPSNAHQIIAGRLMAALARFEPHEVVLAVEIMSGGSIATDRITKPALYAEAGIPYFWRIETEDGQVVVHTYKLDLGHELYRSVGEFTDLIDTPGPWPIKLPVGRITPRFLSAQ